MKTRSSKNDNSNNGEGDEQEQSQLSNSARKRKLNELTNDGKPEPARGEENQQGQEECSSKNSRCDGKNDQQDLEVCSLHIGLKV
jgi:hypothetical protein